MPSAVTPGVASHGCHPARARIAFIRDLGGRVGNEVFTVRPNGTDLKRMTNNKVDEWGPSWSPDGRVIAFSSRRDGDSEIFAMRRNGSGLKKLTDNESSDDLPAWSPDGKRIVFSSTRGDKHDMDSDLFVLNLAGGVRKLVGGADNEWNASWSPTGGWIAFQRADSIFKIRPDGTSMKRLTPDGAVAGNPDWSHDGKLIAFQNDFADSTWMDIYRMKRNGGGLEPILETEVDEQSASWSPQDKRIAHTHQHQLSVAPADGSGESQHLFAEDNTEYSVDWGSPVTCP